ncbi:MAG: TRAP transporter small permease [Candidatus Bathyarchaeia archaeon]
MVSRLIYLANIVALLLLVSMMFLTVCDVGLRYFWRPIPGAMELTEILMVSIGGLSIAWCTLNLGHIKVDIFIRNFSKKVQAKINVTNYIATGILCVFIILALIKRAHQDLNLNTSTYVLGIPQWPFVLLLAFGYLLTFLVLLSHSYRSLRRS